MVIIPIAIIHELDGNAIFLCGQCESNRVEAMSPLDGQLSCCLLAEEIFHDLPIDLQKFAGNFPIYTQNPIVARTKTSLVLPDDSMDVDGEEPRQVLTHAITEEYAKWSLHLKITDDFTNACSSREEEKCPTAIGGQSRSFSEQALRSADRWSNSS
ncbi:hypothetical protein WG66_005036 [Moniliophthora roreri]|nr:hypothetical protein WG66_005036 [Moniliophthora roreri]